MGEYRNNTKWKDHRQSTPTHRLIADSQRQLPCHPSIRIRVKIIEPGVQSRYCPLCHVWRFFQLSEVSALPGLLKMRWLTDSEVAGYKMGLDEAGKSWG